MKRCPALGTPIDETMSCGRPPSGLLFRRYLAALKTADGTTNSADILVLNTSSGSYRRRAGLRSLLYQGASSPLENSRRSREKRNELHRPRFTMAIEYEEIG